MKNFALIAIALGLTAGCIKPPPDRDTIGAEVSVTDKNTALTNAMADLDQEKAFHVSDNGVILVVDNVMTNAMVRETHQDQVTKIDDQFITYTDYVVETKDFGTAKIKRSGAVNPAASPKPSPVTAPAPNPSASPTSSPNGFTAALNLSAPASKNIFEILPDRFERFMTFVRVTVTGFLSHISVQPSTADAQSSEVAPNVAAVLAPVSAGEQSLNAGLDALITKVLKSHGLEPMDDPSLAGTLESGLLNAAPSPGTNPSPAASPASTSRYYGLQVTQEKFLTKNCAQLSDCKVPATRIEYTEVKTSGDGSQRKFHWYYEISTQVPGLFTLLEQCLSTVIIQNGTQYPFRECIHVSDFRWGQAPN